MEPIWVSLAGYLIKPDCRQWYLIPYLKCEKAVYIPLNGFQQEL